MSFPSLCHHIVAIVTILGFAGSTVAHPGRTDANGGHHDRKAGTYHYHNGGSSNSGGGSSIDFGTGGFGTDGTEYSPPQNRTVQPQKPRYGGYPSAPYVRKGPPKASGGWTESDPKNSPSRRSHSTTAPKRSSVLRVLIL